MNKILVWFVSLVIFVSLWVAFSDDVNLAPKKVDKSSQNLVSGLIDAGKFVSFVKETGSKGSDSKMASKFIASLNLNRGS